MVGFSLMHIHPQFFIAGLLCSYGLLLWLVVAGILIFKNRQQLSKTDVAMAALCLCVLVALSISDTAFA